MLSSYHPFRCKVGIPTFRTSIQVHVVSKLSQWIFNPGKTSYIIVMRPSNQRDAPRELRAIQIALRNESQPQRFLPSRMSCTHVLRSVMQESAGRHEDSSISRCVQRACQVAHLTASRSWNKVMVRVRDGFVFRYSRVLRSHQFISHESSKRDMFVPAIPDLSFWLKLVNRVGETTGVATPPSDFQ